MDGLTTVPRSSNGKSGKALVFDVPISDVVTRRELLHAKTPTGIASACNRVQIDYNTPKGPYTKAGSGAVTCYDREVPTRALHGDSLTREYLRDPRIDLRRSQTVLPLALNQKKEKMLHIGGYDYGIDYSDFDVTTAAGASIPFQLVHRGYH